MTDRPSCSSCRWWDQAGSAIAAGTIDPRAQPDLGVCCVDPPKLISVSPYWSAGVFPETHATRFCSEWSPSEEPDGGGEQHPVEPAANVVSFERPAA